MSGCPVVGLRVEVRVWISIEGVGGYLEIECSVAAAQLADLVDDRGPVLALHLGEG